MALKFGCQTYGWYVYFGGDYDMGRVYREIKEAGYDGVDGVPVKSLADLVRQPLMLAELGLKPITVGGPDLRQSIEYAVAMGLSVIEASSGQRPREGRPDYDEFAHRIENIAAYTKRYGLDTIVHTHLWTFLEDDTDIDEAMSRTKEFKLLLDTGHLGAAGGDPVRAIEKYHDRIGLVHLKDWRHDDNHPEDFRRGRFVELGRGNVGIDIPGVLKALEKYNYQGWVAIEQDQTEFTPFDSVKMSREYLKSLGY